MKLKTFGQFSPVKKINTSNLKSKGLEKQKIETTKNNIGGLMLDYKQGSLTIKGILSFLIVATARYIFDSFLPTDVTESVIPVIINFLDIVGLGSLGAVGVGFRRAIDRIEFPQGIKI